MSDYSLTLDCAKELAMLSKVAKGKVARRYFLECEKALRNPFQIPRTLSEALSLAAEQAKTIEEQQALLEIQKPKVEYYDHVLRSGTTYTATHIAKALGMSAVALNRKLCEMGVQYKHRGIWVLYEKYQDLGYTKLETGLYADGTGRKKSAPHTVWTEAGREFVMGLFGRAGSTEVSPYAYAG